MKPDTTFHSRKIPSNKKSSKRDHFEGVLKKMLVIFVLQTWVKPILRIAPMKTEYEYDLEICLSHMAQPTKLTESQ